MSEAIILPQFVPPKVDLSGYSLVTHTHTLSSLGAAASSHSHSGYASSSHSHSGYATQSWVSENFAPKGSGSGSGSGSSYKDLQLSVTIADRQLKLSATTMSAGGAIKSCEAISISGTGYVTSWESKYPVEIGNGKIGAGYDQWYPIISVAAYDSDNGYSGACNVQSRYSGSTVYFQAYYGATGNGWYYPQGTGSFVITVRCYI